MTDPNQRLTAWQIKTDTGKVKQILDTLRPEMLEHYKTCGSSQNADCRCQRSKCGGFSRWRPGSHFAISPFPFVPRHLGRELRPCGQGPARQMGRPRIGFRRPCPNPDRSLRRLSPDSVEPLFLQPSPFGERVEGQGSLPTSA